jgi:hypothetical protein
VSWGDVLQVVVVMIFYLILQKQKIAYHYIPVWVHLVDVASYSMCPGL